MIKVKVNKTKRIESIVMTGHACYDDYGKDIVCSSASSILITTVNGIEKLDNEYLLVSEEKDKVTLTINKENDICYNLIINMIELLEELARQYPENVKVM